MVCQAYVLQPDGFHENDGDDKHDEDNSGNNKTRGLSPENHWNPGYKQRLDAQIAKKQLQLQRFEIAIK